jgi:hypothetical protein
MERRPGGQGGCPAAGAVVATNNFLGYSVEYPSKALKGWLTKTRLSAVWITRAPRGFHCTGTSKPWIGPCRIEVTIGEAYAHKVKAPLLARSGILRTPVQPQRARSSNNLLVPGVFTETFCWVQLANWGCLLRKRDLLDPRVEYGDIDHNLLSLAMREPRTR